MALNDGETGEVVAAPVIDSDTPGVSQQVSQIAAPESVPAPVAPAVPLMRSVIGELRTAANSALSGRSAAIDAAVASLRVDAKKAIVDKFAAYRAAVVSAREALYAKASDEGHVAVEEVHAAFDALTAALTDGEGGIVDTLAGGIATALAMDAGIALHDCITRLEDAW